VIFSVMLPSRTYKKDARVIIRAGVTKGLD